MPRWQIGITTTAGEAVGSLSGILFLETFPNLIITRSLPKGWGMTGIRLGYAVVSSTGGLLLQMKKLVLQFDSNALARTLVLSALKSTLENAEDPFGVKDTARNKAKVMGAVKRLRKTYDRNLQIAQTYEKAPIMLLYYNSTDDAFDLQRHFMKAGLLTVSCSTYVGLGREAVRLMLPQTEQIFLLLKLLEQSIRDFPA